MYVYDDDSAGITTTTTLYHHYNTPGKLPGPNAHEKGPDDFYRRLGHWYFFFHLFSG